VTEVLGDSRKAVRPPARAGARLWPPPKDAWLPIGGVVLLYAGHWFYGALLSDTAMLLGVAAAVLLGVALARPQMREDLLRLRGLEIPAVLFGATILVALWTLTPWTPGGPHPVWGYVGLRPGASTIDKSATTMEIIKLLGLACFFLVGAATGARDERARTAVRALLALGLPFGVWAFIGAVTGLVYQTQGHRLEGHFLNPNTAGTFFAVLLLLSVGELLREVRSRRSEADISRSIVLAMAPLTFAICLLDSVSRGAMLSFLGAALVLLVLHMWWGVVKPTRALLAIMGAIALLLALIWIAGDQLIDRFFQAGQDSIVRTAIWKAHWGAFLNSPLFGYGLGTAETINKTLISQSNYPVLWNIKAILNLYIQWLEEAGVVGTVPMFLCVGSLMVLTLRNAARRTRMVRLLAALVAVDAVFLFHGATDFALEVPSMAAMWAWLLGLQFSLAQGSSRR
jgi:O-antigen ligase